MKGLFDNYQENLRGKREMSRKLVESGGSNDKQSLALRQQMATQGMVQVKQELLQLQSELRKAEVAERILAARVAQRGRRRPGRRSTRRSTRTRVSLTSLGC